jgi:hypothetical protein
MQQATVRLPYPCPAKGNGMRGALSSLGILTLPDIGGQPPAPQKPAAARSHGHLFASLSPAPCTATGAVGSRLAPQSSRQDNSSPTTEDTVAIGSGCAAAERRSTRNRPSRNKAPAFPGWAGVILTGEVETSRRLRYIVAQRCRRASGYRQLGTDRKPLRVGLEPSPQHRRHPILPTNTLATVGWGYPCA